MALSHVTIATKGRHTLFASEAHLLRALRAIVRSPDVVLFCVVDDHVHLVVTGDGPARARAAARTLGALGSAALQRGDVRPVDGRTHLMTLVGYLTRQPAKHGLVSHPALWAGSSAPDLLGVRRLVGFKADRIAWQLPRAVVRDLVADAAHVWRPALEPSDALPDAPSLWRIAHDAVGLTIGDPHSAALTARLAWAHLAVDAPDSGLVPDRTLRWLRARPVDVALIDIIRRRVSLEAWVARQATRDPRSDRPRLAVPPASDRGSALGSVPACREFGHDPP